MQQAMTKTVTVGIPAHNKEGNIEALLTALMAQEQVNFILKDIIVVLDRCTDRTEAIVRNFMRDHPLISLMNDGRQIGKVGRLNELYQQNKSDLLLTIDADVLPATSKEIALLVENFRTTYPSSFGKSNTGQTEGVHSECHLHTLRALE